MNIYVGNLSYSMTDGDLEEAFAEFGAVTSATVIMDRDSGRSKGFGFVVDDESKEEYFVHISGLIDEVREGDVVEFDLKEGRFLNQTQNFNFLQGRQSENFSLLMQKQSVSINKTERKILLDAILMYFKIHIEGFRQIKSVEVLEVVLG